ncbi:bifunctional phosphoribosylaminoimidazolecarboxamide formyltransferase/IMP cyclohydrolase [Helicobacter muridarum]|uniref:Bifunctional purine biosynthesis protein PurH n=1 Tax=Helicobacter muridarum TaxID=216 RepID=A0A377PYG6_9HELI|nr:bifunctional phosphoribosylaminoimidazolecarboxamide formyltransferase/IMP cyclohydrolase [Helicobacter muridarum]TLE00855.1 bifunctional phosphoribosylaminoimidazolecarboxamide formyltransferase/IMP cyclohydrolase [Helicobacter muridarum]STQ86623.1 phosphoribosylaminoimidazolecarboxamide formyltransferase/IMP cyclohydrolase [Helicobacter muridarum]
MQKYAIISVSDKSNIESFTKKLIDLGYKILSTGGTLQVLKQYGIEASDISSYTYTEEMFDGRVKTLHPKIHGGILFRRNNDKDIAQAIKANIVSIDVVCVNLYQFHKTIQRSNDFDEIIEDIDIGGHTLIRAAAKNFQDVTVVVDPNSYEEVIQSLSKKDHLELLEFRKELMIKAFNHIAQYDCIIANYMNEKFKDGFGEKKFIVGSCVMQTNYGENPHQKGALYETENFYSKYLHIHKGNISFNNLIDINAALKIIRAFGDSHCACIIKHGNPCGFAIRNDIISAYQGAMICDSVSAYGGVLAINTKLDIRLAQEILKNYAEVVVCRDIDLEALEMFKTKKRIKIVTCSLDRTNSNCTSNHLVGFCAPSDAWNFKHIEGGFVYQQSDKIESNEVYDAKLVSNKVAEDSQKLDLDIAYKLAAFTKSNCVVFVKDKTLVAIGMGMTSRVDAMFAAIKKAKEMSVNLNDSVLASEAFFPFKDSIELASTVGVSAIIEPGGSIRDNEVIDEANRRNIALYFSGKRHFLH